MQKISFIFLLLFVLVASSILAQDLPYKKETKDGKEYYIYQVESGEGLYSVCRKFSISQEDIIKNNPDTEDGLKSGQVLRIPTKRQLSKTDDTAFFFHTIDQGETLGSIAMMYSVSVSSIKKLNPDAERNIKVGFTLKIPQTVKVPQDAGIENYIYHTIAPRETLFQLANKYNISVQDIMDVNPGLTAGSFLVGKVIKIDASKNKQIEPSTKANVDQKEETYIDYMIRKNESVLSISRKFNITKDSLLILNPNLRTGIRLGMTIQVPISKPSDNKSETVEVPATTVLNNEPLKVALMLPFMTDDSSEESSKQSRRFVEYYEGFLLAIEKLKSDGLSVELHVYDTGAGTQSVSNLLKDAVLADVQLIIGPVFNEHIDPVAKFAKTHNIEMVIPFTSKNDDVLTNPFVLQLNTPHSYLYSETSQLFCKRFKNNQIVFLGLLNKVGDKADFVAALKTELKRHSMVYKSFVAKNADEIEQIASALSIGQENVIVPVSGSSNDLKQMVPALQSVVMSNPNLKVSLFGYPEWQTYVNDYMGAFHNLNTYIYSTFFVKTTSPEYKEFNARFRSWYQRDMINSYPKYGVLGYDTGLYFLKAMAITGNHFDKNILNNSFHGIQTGFSFERVNNWGGLINKNVYLINYGRNSEISKLISDK